MRRSVGLAGAAIVLSLTLGVLIGLLIHMGMTQRAEPPRHDVAAIRSSGENTGAATLSDESAGPTDPLRGSRASAEPWPASLTPVTDDGTALATPAAGLTQAASSPPSSQAPPERPTTPATPATSAGMSPTPSGASATTTASSTPSGTASGNTPNPGHDVPRGSCQALGAKSATADGASLFCQRDPGDRSLRWRPVTDGGGCLNRTMTGVGLDGKPYACRVGPDGLNHWALAR